MNNKMMEEGKYTRSKADEKKHRKLQKKCMKYKKTVKKRRCNLDQYIAFSGAQTKL